MNYFVLGASLLYFAATFQAGWQEKWPLAGVYIAYAMANAFLVYIDLHTK